MTDFTALAQARFSVRSFRPDPIPADILDAILDDARFSASWSNTRPYCVAVASGERAERLRTAYVSLFDAVAGVQRREPRAVVRALLSRSLPRGDFPVWRRYPDSLRPRSVKVGVDLYRHLGIAREDRAGRDAHNRANFAFFQAPTILFVFVHDQMLPFSAHDAGLMLATLMLSATSAGLGSCPLGALGLWRRPVDDEFAVPAHYRLITGLALGYPSTDHVNDFRAEHPALSLVPER